MNKKGRTRNKLQRHALAVDGLRLAKHRKYCRDCNDLTKHGTAKGVSICLECGKKKIALDKRGRTF